MFRTIDEIRKDTKPLVLLGDSNNLHHIVEICESSGRQVVGIIDPDYPNQTELKGLKLLDKETYLAKKDHYEFFVSTWWFPFYDKVYFQMIEKRNMFLAWMKEYDLVGATVIHATAVVSPRAKIARNVSVGALSMLIANCEIHENVNVKEQAYVSHDVVIGANSMVQIKSTLTGKIIVGRDTYIGVAATVVNARSYAVMNIGDRVVIHPNQLVVTPVANDTVISYKKPAFLKKT
jgi:acetyltransferase-like isoleucine patch superfamily enzyme